LKEAVAMPDDANRKRRASDPALSRQKLTIHDERSNNKAPPTYRTGTDESGPIRVTPLVLLPDRCLVEIDGEERLILSELLFRLWREGAVACGCGRCSGGPPR
jgi:hypothetical protein